MISRPIFEQSASSKPGRFVISDLSGISKDSLVNFYQQTGSSHIKSWCTEMGVWRTKKVLQFELLATSQACIDLEQGPVREDGEHSGRHQVDQLRPQPCLLCPLGHQQNQAFYDHQAYCTLGVVCSLPYVLFTPARGPGWSGGQFRRMKDGTNHSFHIFCLFYVCLHTSIYAPACPTWLIEPNSPQPSVMIGPAKPARFSNFRPAEQQMTRHTV